MKQQYKIELWMLPVEPMQGYTGQKKVFINLYSSALKENDNYYADEVIRDYARRIMDEFDWGLNLDWGIIKVSDCEGVDEGLFELTESPKEKRKKEIIVIKEKQLAEFRDNLAELVITKKDIEFDEKTADIVVKNKLAGDIRIPINEFYKLIETKTPNATLTNSFGEQILEILNGSFLNAGLADIKVFANAKDMAEHSFYNPKEKGGIFIREDGRLDFGDIKRTKYMSVNLSNFAREWYLKKLNDNKFEMKSIELIKQLEEYSTKKIK